MAEAAELKHMVMSFRVSELQVLLGFAGRNKSGRKHELLTKALQLLKSGCSSAVQIKIKELYRRRFPRKILTPSDLSMLHLQAGQLPSATALTQGAMCHLPYDNGAVASGMPAGMLPPVPMLGSKHEADVPHLSPPVHPVHPDVKMRRLPFYDVYDELIKPTTLASVNSQRFEEAHFTFALTPQQVQQILTSRDILPGAKCDYTVQVQLRFCLCETSCPQEDYFPPNLFVKINGKLCPLPGYLPPTKNGAEPKRPSRPINITPLVRLSATVPNTIVVNWSSEFGRNYSLSVYLVKQLTSVTLLQKLRAKGIRNPDHSRALIKEKLTADPDSEIATTSLRVSLMCPLGKMRLIVPCRAFTCTHLQCFDAALYLQMNEKKPTWTCPVCDKKAPYEGLIIDGLFMEILNSVTDCDEIQFMEDGSWCPMKPKKENQEVCQPSAYNGLEASLYTVSSEGKPLPESKKKVEVIDLTLDSSSDDEELLAKKVCSVAIAAIPPAAGPKWVLNADHQPSSVLRSPSMAAMGSDFLSSLPLSDYHPSYPVPSDIQGLDLFSFLQSENQVESWNKHDQKLFDAVEKGDVTRTFLFASRKTAHPTKLNALGQSAFHLAASKGLTECLTILLTHGADVNEKNEDGSTALHLATIACQPQCVKVLLQHGANEDCLDGENRTPLHWAALSGCASSVLLLCDQEAFLDVTDKNERTPLMIAAQGNQTAICSQLLQRGAKVDLLDKDGKTALILACETGGVEAADLLLQNGANVALMDQTGHDAVYYATRSKNRVLRRQIRTALKKWKKRELGIFDSSETGSQVPSESGKETDVSSLAFQSEAGDQSDDEEEAEEGPELREWRSRFREEKMKVIQLELQLDQKTKECQALSMGSQSLKEKVWDQVQEISQILPDREGRNRDWRQPSRRHSHDHMEEDHCLDLLAQQVRELKERKKQQEAEKELPKASTPEMMASPTRLQPGRVQWPGEEETEELKRLQSELQAALEEKASAARRVEEMEGHMENMRAVIGVFEAKKKSQSAALKEMEARALQLGDENQKLRGLLGKHLAGPPESSLARAKVAQCMKEMEETQARAREEMAAMLAENEDLKKEAEEAVRSRLQFQAVPSGAVKKCISAWKKVVAGLEGALAKLEQACTALLDKARPLQEAILESPSKTLVNGNGLPEEEKNGCGHQPGRSETPEELQKSGVEKPQLHNGLVSQVKLRPKPEAVESKARPCRRSSDLEKEVWDLKQNNGGLVQELAQLSREREKLQEELQKLHGPKEGSPRAEKTERLMEELKRTVEFLSHELSLEKEESGKLRLKLEEQRKEMAFVRNNFLKKVSQEAGGIVGENLDSCILKELHWKLDNVVRKQNEALQLVSEMEEENHALQVDRTLPPDLRSPGKDKPGQEIFLEASEVIGENWRVREQMVELEKGLQEMKKLLVASQGTPGGIQVVSLMQLLDRVLAQMADLRQEEEQVLSKYEKICSMLSTRAQVLGEELAALREKYEETSGASAHHREALDREQQKTQELMAEALEHEEEVEELRGKSQKLEGTVDKLNKKVDDIAKMCQERDIKIKKLLKETEKLSSEILNLRSERTRLILQNEVAQKNHQEIVAVYRTHLLNAAQGYMDEEVHAMLLRILRTD